MATEKPMALGMIGLGRMGANLARRLMADGHRCHVFDLNREAVSALEAEGAIGAASPEELAGQLDPARMVWIMVPAAAVGATLDGLVPHLAADDVIIDGGNSHDRDDIARARRLRARGLHYVDCGTSGGVWGLERGYCLMIGGEPEPVRRLTPIFASIAPGRNAHPTSSHSRAGSTAADGYLHCGPPGAGHFVKMVHNGVEYGMMAAIAEGLSIIAHADQGTHQPVDVDAETATLRDPDRYHYAIDVAAVAEVWRRGSVVSSWLMDLTADALARSPDLTQFAGRVSDSGEGRWTVEAAVELGVPAPVITAALYDRFNSRGNAVFTDKLLSAMRSEFGGHAEKNTA